MGEPQPRVATLVLCTSTGEVLGALPAFQAALPWWQDAESLVCQVREQYGVEVTILRLLDAALPEAPGGRVVYLAEISEDSAAGLPLQPWPGVLRPHPLRLPYAEPGGPGRDLAWATTALAAQGTGQRGPAQQVRTWNLSSLWRIPLESGNAWLKCVPPFFAHEGAILSALHGSPVPRLLAHQDGRILMPEISGEDQYDAPLPILRQLVSILVELQSDWAGRVDELLALGLPDWRFASLAASIESVVRKHRRDLEEDERRILDTFLVELPARLSTLEATGIPDSIVHGDFAPGNARGDRDHLVLLDWGDCGVGNPLLDQSAFVDRVDPASVSQVLEHWNHAWRQAVPGSDPSRAGQLLAPVAAARQAVIYQGFLDRIEPSEHPYHRLDPVRWLRRVVALAERS